MSTFLDRLLSPTPHGGPVGPVPMTGAQRDELLTAGLDSILSELAELRASVRDAARYRECVSASFLASSAGYNEIVAPAHGAICVVNYVLVTAGAVTFQWGQGNDGGDFGTFGGTGANAGRMSFAANGGLSASAGAPPAHLLRTQSGMALAANLGGAVEVGGHLLYYVSND